MLCSAVAIPGAAYARIRQSLWIVDCPALYCRNAVAVPRFLPVVTCPACGYRADVVWPAAEFVDGIERLLMMRPDWVTRNWWPHEDLHDLLRENLEHSVIPADPDELEDGVILTITSDRITYMHPAVAACPARLELDEAAPKMLELEA